jgi:hypothetical protein
VTPADVIREIERAGGILEVRDDRIRYSLPKSVGWIVAELRKHKLEIVAAIRRRGGRPSTCSPHCYEEEAGVWIHRPWAGCTTCRSEASAAGREVSMTCWHCKGERTCGCCTCAPGSLSKARECFACKGAGQLWRWIQ